MLTLLLKLLYGPALLATLVYDVAVNYIFNVPLIAYYTLQHGE